MNSLAYGEHHYHPKLASGPTLKRSCSLPKFNGNGMFGEYPTLARREFITVVEVDQQGNPCSRTIGEDDDFVTVLSVDSNNDDGHGGGDPNGHHQSHHQRHNSPPSLSSSPSSSTSSSPSSSSSSQPKTLIEQVTVYRLPGERLGMALKFEGGANPEETIKNLYIQSVNPESPASRIQGSILGRLCEGDELLEIDGKSVNSMTRIECVATLKDVPVCFKMLVMRQASSSCSSSTNKDDEDNNGKMNATKISKFPNYGHHHHHHHHHHHNTGTMSMTTSTLPHRTSNQYYHHQSGGQHSNNPRHILQRVNSENGLSTASTLQRLKRGPPPPVPPRMATTSLTTNIGNGGHNQRCIGRSSSTTSSLRRPSQPPPLPPRRSKDTTLSSLMDNNNKYNGNNGGHGSANGKRHTFTGYGGSGSTMMSSDDEVSGRFENVNNHHHQVDNDQDDDNYLFSSLCNQATSLPVNLSCTVANNNIRNNQHHSQLHKNGVVNHDLADRSDSEIPLPEHFMDTISIRKYPVIESESDDTGSSVSTVIERFSRSSTANSSFSEHSSSHFQSNSNSNTEGNCSTVDIDKVLDPFEELERELDATGSLSKLSIDSNGIYNPLNGNGADNSTGNNSLPSTTVNINRMNCESARKYLEAISKQSINTSSKNLPTMHLKETENKINLDDYDDIQSVSMSYMVNKLSDQIVEPPTCFSNHFDCSANTQSSVVTNNCSDIRNNTDIGPSSSTSSIPPPPPPTPPPSSSSSSSPVLIPPPPLPENFDVPTCSSSVDNQQVPVAKSTQNKENGQEKANNNMIDSVVHEANSNQNLSRTSEAANDINEVQSCLSSTSSSSSSVPLSCVDTVPKDSRENNLSTTTTTTTETMDGLNRSKVEMKMKNKVKNKSKISSSTVEECNHQNDRSNSSVPHTSQPDNRQLLPHFSLPTNTHCRSNGMLTSNVTKVLSENRVGSGNNGDVDNDQTVDPNEAKKYITTGNSRSSKCDLSSPVTTNSPESRKHLEKKKPIIKDPVHKVGAGGEKIIQQQQQQHNRLKNFHTLSPSVSLIPKILEPNKSLPSIITSSSPLLPPPTPTTAFLSSVSSSYVFSPKPFCSSYKSKSTLNLSIDQKSRPSLIPRLIMKQQHHQLQQQQQSSPKLSMADSTKIPVRRSKSIGNMKSLMSPNFVASSYLLQDDIINGNRQLANMSKLDNIKKSSELSTSSTSIATTVKRANDMSLSSTFHSLIHSGSPSQSNHPSKRLEDSGVFVDSPSPELTNSTNAAGKSESLGATYIVATTCRVSHGQSTGVHLDFPLPPPPSPPPPPPPPSSSSSANSSPKVSPQEPVENCNPLVTDPEQVVISSSPVQDVCLRSVPERIALFQKAELSIQNQEMAHLSSSSSSKCDSKKDCLTSQLEAIHDIEMLVKDNHGSRRPLIETLDNAESISNGLNGKQSQVITKSSQAVGYISKESIEKGEVVDCGRMLAHEEGQVLNEWIHSHSSSLDPSSPSHLESSSSLSSPSNSSSSSSHLTGHLSSTSTSASKKSQKCNTFNSATSHTESNSHQHSPSSTLSSSSCSPSTSTTSTSSANNASSLPSNPVARYSSAGHIQPFYRHFTKPSSVDNLISMNEARSPIIDSTRHPPITTISSECIQNHVNNDDKVCHSNSSSKLPPSSNMGMIIISDRLSMESKETIVTSITRPIPSIVSNTVMGTDLYHKTSETSVVPLYNHSPVSAVCSTRVHRRQANSFDTSDPARLYCQPISSESFSSSTSSCSPVTTTTTTTSVNGFQLSHSKPVIPLQPSVTNKPEKLKPSPQMESSIVNHNNKPKEYRRSNTYSEGGGEEIHIPSGRAKSLKETFERVRKLSESNLKSTTSTTCQDEDLNLVTNFDFSSETSIPEASFSDSCEPNLESSFDREKKVPIVEQNNKLSNSEQDQRETESLKNFRALLEKWEKRFASEQADSLNVNRNLSSAQPSSLFPPKARRVMRVSSMDCVSTGKTRLFDNQVEKDHGLNKVSSTNRLPSHEEANLNREEHFSSSCRNIFTKSSSQEWPYSACQSERLSSFSQSETDVPCKESGDKSSARADDVNYDSRTSLSSTSTGPTCEIDSSVKTGRSVSVSDIRRVFESQVLSEKVCITDRTIKTQLEGSIQIPHIEKTEPDDEGVDEMCETLIEEEDDTVKDKSECSETIEEQERSETCIFLGTAEVERNESRTNHSRAVSTDSTASDSGNSSPEGNSANKEWCGGSSIGSRASSVSNLRDSQFGSVTSLASTASLISPQELQNLIDEANQSLDGEMYNQNPNIQVIVLHREYSTSGSIGITLAGGSDYETKEIVVHKIIKGSIADRDGRIRKGDRVLSINGKILKGATHKEALKILKSPRPEVVIVISRNISKIGENSSESNGNSGLDSNDINLRLKKDDDEFDIMMGSNDNYQILKAALVKDGAGLGFILEGGRDSIYLERGRDLTLLDRGRDKPLAIKRIFKGCG
ncbi:uncharacterized protein LOC141850751 isoform X2 [Brevipalpus obovatus]|uniref:uncharacterized protein LOC141850751 isoform X2 n=1 Tax=Brevipalpus obovatus TaxID=246614 RepID=UPI003D9E5E00